MLFRICFPSNNCLIAESRYVCVPVLVIERDSFSGTNVSFTALLTIVVRFILVTAYPTLDHEITGHILTPLNEEAPLASSVVLREILAEPLCWVNLFEQRFFYHVI
ncbi:hypothetical protein D3C84_871300 [compost metagenome]